MCTSHRALGEGWARAQLRHVLSSLLLLSQGGGGRVGEGVVLSMSQRRKGEGTTMSALHQLCHHEVPVEEEEEEGWVMTMTMTMLHRCRCHIVVVIMCYCCHHWHHCRKVGKGEGWVMA